MPVPVCVRVVQVNVTRRGGQVIRREWLKKTRDMGGKRGKEGKRNRGVYRYQ